MMINYLFIFYFYDVGLFFMVSKYNGMSGVGNRYSFFFSFSILLIIISKYVVMVLTYYLRTYIYKPNYEIIKYFFIQLSFVSCLEEKIICIIHILFMMKIMICINNFLCSMYIF